MIRLSTATKIGYKYNISFVGANPWIFIPESWAYTFNTTYGIRGGGRASGGSITNKYERATLGTETNATNAATLSNSLYKYDQVVGNDIKSMICGGDNDTAGGAKSTAIDTYTFSSNTNALSSGTLTAARYFGGGGSGKNFGYIVGGNTTGATNTTNKIVIGTETVTAGPTISVTGNGLRGCGTEASLYIVGTSGKTTDKIIYATNTATTVANTVAMKYQTYFRINYGGTHCYMVTGGTPASTATEKLAVSTETSAATTAATTAETNGCSNASTTKVYACGGYTTGFTTYAQGYVTATDTCGAVAGMNGIAVESYSAGI